MLLPLYTNSSNEWSSLGPAAMECILVGGGTVAVEKRSVSGTRGIVMVVQGSKRVYPPTIQEAEQADRMGLARHLWALQFALSAAFPCVTCPPSSPTRFLDRQFGSVTAHLLCIGLVPTSLCTTNDTPVRRNHPTRG